MTASKLIVSLILLGVPPQDQGRYSKRPLLIVDNTNLSQQALVGYLARVSQKYDFESTTFTVSSKSETKAQTGILFYVGRQEEFALAEVNYHLVGSTKEDFRNFVERLSDGRAFRRRPMRPEFLSDRLCRLTAAGTPDRWIRHVDEYAFVMESEDIRRLSIPRGRSLSQLKDRLFAARIDGLALENAWRKDFWGGIEKAAAPVLQRRNQETLADYLVRRASTDAQLSLLRSLLTETASLTVYLDKRDEAIKLEVELVPLEKSRLSRMIGRLQSRRRVSLRESQTTVGEVHSAFQLPPTLREMIGAAADRLGDHKPDQAASLRGVIDSNHVEFCIGLSGSAERGPEIAGKIWSPKSGGAEFVESLLVDLGCTAGPALTDGPALRTLSLPDWSQLGEFDASKITIYERDKGVVLTVNKASATSNAETGRENVPKDRSRSLLSLNIDIGALLSDESGWSEQVKWLEDAFDRGYVSGVNKSRNFIVAGELSGSLKLNVLANTKGVKLRLNLPISLADALAARFAYTVERALAQ
jgi:hypothetical protein